MLVCTTCILPASPLHTSVCCPCRSLDKVEQVLGFLATEVGLGRGAAARAILTHPTLLFKAISSMRANMAALRVMLEGGCWSAEEMVATEPSLLCK